MTGTARHAQARGGPLVMLALLLGGWGTARVMWWEHPFVPDAEAIGIPVALRRPAATWGAFAPALMSRETVSGISRTGAGDLPRRLRNPIHASAPARPAPLAPAPAGVPRPAAPDGERAPEPVPPPASAPFLPPPARPASIAVPAAAPAVTRPGRWSLDAWTLWRQGSDAAPVSQGRVPIYGASQAGAVLQYRLAPASPRDPRLYARAYRALVRRGESEVAAGASLRPLPRVPVRVAAELRYTDAAAFEDLRPAAYAVTELAPLSLPLGARLEAYGQAGWVGGPGATPFADGFVAVTREVPQAARLGGTTLRVSLGLAAWGGAQRDAERLDMGPTLRLDTRIGKVPARLTVDWRARVAGDASPGSGVAATLSTGF
jgi:hypothetical protein